MGLSFLVRNFCLHVAVADVELLVEMRQLPARVLEEEFSVQREGCREYIGEQKTTVGKDVCGIRLPDDDFERDENLEFTHKGEADGKHHRNRDEERVGDHGFCGC